MALQILDNELGPLVGFNQTDRIVMRRQEHRQGRVYNVFRGQFGHYRHPMMKIANLDGVLRDDRNIQERSHQALALNEVSMLQSFAECENIVQLLHHERSPTQICLVVMEYTINCSEYLRELENGVIQRANELNLPSIFKQLFEALHFIHGNQVVHRDLRSKNVYLKITQGKRIILY